MRICGTFSVFWQAAILSLTTLMLSSGCDSSAAPITNETSDVLAIVTTTTMLADLVDQLGGEDVQVYSLVSYGADPHVYQPRPSDARRISESDLVVMNGLLLEGWMENLVRHAGGERPVVVAGDIIDPEALLRVEGAVDPHIWLNPRIWRQVSTGVYVTLRELLDPEAAERLERRFGRYDDQLAQLDEWARAQLATIPSDQRVLITSHDAFNYFGDAYELRVEAIMGVSTEQEASQRDVANTIELVRQLQARAVFLESSVNRRLIAQVARETGVTIAGPLYSDSLGGPESGANTYLDMFRKNIEIIVTALGGQVTGLDDEPLDTHGESR